MIFPIMGDFIRINCTKYLKPLTDLNNVANKIILKYGNDITIQDGTVYRYTLEARNELYGKPFMSVGKNGYCSYQWCKETDIDDSGIITLAPLTAAEEVIKKDLTICGL